MLTSNLNLLLLLLGVIVLGVVAWVCYAIGRLHGYDAGVKVRQGQHTESTVYFGRDDSDHPDDIERQGSHLVPAPSASPYVNGRDYDARYDGMADIEHLHDQQDRA